ncbi:dynein axonemal intermediate chain 7 [Tiliqua scincoides]|uniref:dynein axonemal intermediate chain 7 n=1 Tax=Tiliqua scincoides TaxID=71010 RepID=UPI003461C3E4
MEEALRLERERIEKEKTEQLEAKDQERRGRELAELQELEERFLVAAQSKERLRASAKWEHYTACDGSPDPTIPQEINTFMSLWQEDKNNDIKTVVEKGNSVLKLIQKLKFILMDSPYTELTSSDVLRYQETILQLQALLHQKYNQATEQLLKQASSYAESESGNMEVVIKETGVTLCIWANLKKNPRFRSQIFYDEVREPINGFELPKALAICDVAVRILHTHYDHVSPLRIFPKELLNPDISETKPMITVTTPASSAERSAFPFPGGSCEEAPGEQRVLLLQHTPPAAAAAAWPVRVCARRTSAQASALGIIEEEEEQPDKNVVDLHQFMPVGGVYHFDALKLPPQAKHVKGWTMVEVLDTGLEFIPYVAECEENEDPSLVTVGLTVQLLDSVIYFEEPLIARWDTESQCWRTDDIGEVAYNMREKEISFKMNRFYTVTLLQDAHVNMPYQSWELQPKGTDEALFSILTTFAEVQIEIKVDLCKLVSVTTMEDTVLLPELRGRWMTPLALSMALKEAGMNIFPTEYSPKYVSMNKKTLLAEITAYQQMALVASAFAFGWSKWNAQCEEDQTVFKACEHLVEEDVPEDWVLFMFSGQRAQRLEITEDSDVFSKNIAEGTEFHSTLYHLIKDMASEAAMETIKKTHYLFIDTVFQLLFATRVLTYS